MDYKNNPRILFGSFFIIIYGGFHNWGYPKIDFYSRNSHLKMDDLGVPYFWKLPYI